MTICNMSIEAGARAGMIAPDDTTFAYLEGRPLAPKGAAWDEALERWRSLRDRRRRRRSTRVSRSTSTSSSPRSPGARTRAWSLPVDGRVPVPRRLRRPRRARRRRAGARVHGPRAGDARSRTSPSTACSSARARTPGSRTCGRRRASSPAASGRPRVRALVVPGSAQVKRAAEEEGLDRIFRDAGFEWREAGCSMCLGMNPDVLGPGERCASTSNRNFEGRQGRGGRTHLVSPAMAAAAAIEGHFVDVRELSSWEPDVKPFRRVTGASPSLDRADVDTDQIVPEQFLKRIERTGFGEFLFHDWRFDQDGEPRPDFELNDPAYAGAKMLLAGRNFGCGSSREHAPWALAGLRLRGRDRAVVRRHLPHQLHEDRARPDRARGRRGQAASWSR